METTPRLLDLLDAYGARATFFVSGYQTSCLYTDKVAALVQRMVRSGHQVGSHGWCHVSLEHVPRDYVADQLSRTDEAISVVLGASPRFFRPPWGGLNNPRFNLTTLLTGGGIGGSSESCGDSVCSPAETRTDLSKHNRGARATMTDLPTTTPSSSSSVSASPSSSSFPSGRQQEHATADPGDAEYHAEYEEPSPMPTLPPGWAHPPPPLPVPYSITLWSFDTEDWKENVTHTLELYAALFESLRPGDSVLSLNHDTRNATVSEIIPVVLAMAANAQLRFVTVGECLGFADPVEWYRFARRVNDTTKSETSYNAATRTWTFPEVAPELADERCIEYNVSAYPDDYVPVVDEPLEIQGEVAVQ